MKLSDTANRRLYQLSRNYHNLVGKFANFREGVERLNVATDEDWRGKVDVESAGDGLSFKVRSLSIELEFKMFVRPAENNIAKGMVMCLLHSPRLDMTEPLVLGNFGFDFLGNTDIDDSPGSQPYEMTWAGAPVFVHFLDLAIARDPL